MWDKGLSIVALAVPSAAAAAFAYARPTPPFAPNARPRAEKTHSDRSSPNSSDNTPPVTVCKPGTIRWHACANTGNVSSM